MDLYEIQVQLTDTSICERGFSTMNLLKTAKRSCMGNKPATNSCASSWSSVSLARSGRTHPKFQSRKSSRNGAIRANVDATRELSGLARLWLLMCNVYDMHVSCMSVGDRIRIGTWAGYSKMSASKIRIRKKPFTIRVSKKVQKLVYTSQIHVNFQHCVKAPSFLVPVQNPMSFSFGTLSITLIHTKKCSGPRSASGTLSEPDPLLMLLERAPVPFASFSPAPARCCY